ncbi:MAG TPA: ribonuclease III domain-containing protein [Candidatus Paceibacterota bacterium]|nr:ribonuclease III domain-containing protein [Candidatus Paceibacterota bacterium]
MTTPLHVVPPKRLDELQNLLSVRFIDTALLAEALMHPSYRSERKDKEYAATQERVEFIGDRIISLRVALYLHRFYQDRNPSFVTQVSSEVVSNRTFAGIAEKIGLPPFIVMGPEKRKDFLAGNEAIRLHALSCTFEAIVGALFLDRGMRPVEPFLKRHLYPSIEDIIIRKLYIAPKTRLQDLLQAEGAANLFYRTLQVSPPSAREAVFSTSVFLKGVLLGEGTGGTKKAAETSAAEDALQGLESRP